MRKLKKDNENLIEHYICIQMYSEYGYLVVMQLWNIDENAYNTIRSGQCQVKQIHLCTFCKQFINHKKTLFNELYTRVIHLSYDIFLDSMNGHSYSKNNVITKHLN